METHVAKATPGEKVVMIAAILGVVCFLFGVFINNHSKEVIISGVILWIIAAVIAPFVSKG